MAYKPDIDDLRESPAVEIARELKRQVDGELLVVEPNLTGHSEFDLTPLDEALTQADIVVVLVAHTPFKHIPAKKLAEKIVIDTCGALR